MSDTPPDRDEASAAPDGPRNPWVGWLVWAVLVPVLYVLSIGPVSWLQDKLHLPDEVMAIYLPLEYLPYPQKIMLLDYLRWWRP